MLPSLMHSDSPTQHGGHPSCLGMSYIISIIQSCLLCDITANPDSHHVYSPKILCVSRMLSYETAVNFFQIFIQREGLYVYISISRVVLSGWHTWCTSLLNGALCIGHSRPNKEVRACNYITYTPSPTPQFEYTVYIFV